jgi:NAD(P)-dependent dehydrogenase (short-subunit alcohol dehydrogenase family)
LKSVQLLAAGAKVVATVRSINSSPELQALHAQYSDRLTVVTMDVGDFASIKVR